MHSPKIFGELLLPVLARLGLLQSAMSGFHERLHVEEQLTENLVRWPLRKPPGPCPRRDLRPGGPAATTGGPRLGGDVRGAWRRPKPQAAAFLAFALAARAALPAFA